MVQENCSHNCSTCGENCKDRSSAPAKLPLNKQSTVKHVIGVVSGKGGVGKSFVTGLLASEMARRGFSCGVLDGDITGPSMPQLFGIHKRATGTHFGIFPVKSKTGVDVMSLNLLLENETDPVIWRGAMITGAVQQFWTDVIWDVDYLFIDMPPGTGDVTLTVFQSLKLDGIIIVSSPQQLVQMIVGKAVKMAQKMNVPILGLVENMGYLECPDCHKKIELYGPSKADEMGQHFGISTVVRLPLNPASARMADEGKIEDLAVPALAPLADKAAAL